MSYYLLIASLPALPRHFEVKHAPIPPFLLEQRLKLLPEEDAARLNELIDFLIWDRQSIDRTEQEVIDEYLRFESLPHYDVIRLLVEHRMNVRTLVCGLRNREIGREPPEGVGPFLPIMRKKWQEPFFGLEQRFPWLESFERERKAGNAVAAERILLQATWRRWSRMAAEYTFSFEAIVLYYARWEIITRWTSRNAKRGETRFDQLVTKVLESHEFVNI